VVGEIVVVVVVEPGTPTAAAVAETKALLHHSYRGGQVDATTHGNRSEAAHDQLWNSTANRHASKPYPSAVPWNGRREKTRAAFPRISHTAGNGLTN
jgi:hypothetical protein